MLKRILIQNHVKADFSKLFLLKSYISIYKLNIICISETFINSDTAFDDDNLKTERYNIVKPDNHSNSRQSGVCRFINSHWL